MSTPDLPVDWPLVKPPNGVLDFEWDWGANWLPPGDSIIASTFTADGEMAVDSSSFTATSTLVQLSGGVLGVWNVENSVTTAAGRVMNWTKRLRIGNT